MKPVLALALPCLVALAALPAAANDIVRCKAPGGAVTYQAGACPDNTEESRPRISAGYPEPNKAETQRIFEREAALDKRLEARRDRETAEQQMREARAEREAERERELLAAQAQQQYVVAYPLWYGGRPMRRAGQPHPAPRPSGRPIYR